MSDVEMENTSPVVVVHSNSGNAQQDEAPAMPEAEMTWGELCGSIKDRTGAQWGQTFVRACAIVFFLYFFLFSLDLMGSSFKILGGCSAGGMFNSVTNPIAGLMIGIIGTVLVQSSSTSTSVVVSLVGAGAMSVPNAIPVIMGANIGTSVTNTIVSVGQINDPAQFKRAFSGATVHDMFNFCAVLVLLPLELMFGLLEHLTASMMPDEVSDGEQWEGPIKAWVGPLVKQVVVVNKDVTKNIARGKTTCEKLYAGVAAGTEKVGLIKCDKKLGCPAFYQKGATQEEDFASGTVMLVISLLLLVICLAGLVKVLQGAVMGSSTRALRKATNLHPALSILVGTGITILVQSSSITTSVLTPLVGLDIISLEQMFPLTLGANIGTTCTALLASMVSTKPESVQIALCHLFFNLFGILIWYPVPVMRQIPLQGAKNLGEATLRYKATPLVYICTMFIIIPLCLLGVSTLYDLGGSYVVLGVMLTVALAWALVYGLYWWFKKDGKQAVLNMLGARQERRTANQNLPQMYKDMAAFKERLVALETTVKAVTP